MIDQPDTYPQIRIDCTDGEFEFTVTSLAADGVPPVVVNLDPYHTPVHQANLVADAVREVMLRQTESWIGRTIERPAPIASTGPDQYVGWRSVIDAAREAIKP